MFRVRKISVAHVEKGKRKGRKKTEEIKRNGNKKMLRERVIFILQMEWPSEDMRVDRKAYVHVVKPANYQVIARRLQEMQFHKWEVCIGTCMRDYLHIHAILHFLCRVLRELPIDVCCLSSNHPKSYSPSRTFNFFITTRDVTCQIVRNARNEI